MSSDELWDAVRVGRELNPDKPLTTASARKEMSRAGISAVWGYPAGAVRDYMRRRRKGRGHRSDLDQKEQED